MAWEDSEQRRRRVEAARQALAEATLSDEFDMMHPRGRLGRFIEKGASKVAPRSPLGRGGAALSRTRTALKTRGVPGSGADESINLGTLTVHSGRAGFLPGPRRVRLTTLSRGKLKHGHLSKGQRRNRREAGLGDAHPPERPDAEFYGYAVDDKGLWYVWTQTRGRDGLLTPAIGTHPPTSALGGGTEFGVVPGLPESAPMTATLPREPSILAREYQRITRQRMAKMGLPDTSPWEHEPTHMRTGVVMRRPSGQSVPRIPIADVYHDDVRAGRRY